MYVWLPPVNLKKTSPLPILSSPPSQRLQCCWSSNREISQVQAEPVFTLQQLVYAKIQLPTHEQRTRFPTWNRSCTLGPVIHYLQGVRKARKLLSTCIHMTTLLGPWRKHSHPPPCWCSPYCRTCHHPPSHHWSCWGYLRKKTKEKQKQPIKLHVSFCIPMLAAASSVLWHQWCPA